MTEGREAMTNKELASYLEALKIIVQSASSTTEIIEAIEKLQSKLKE